MIHKPAAASTDRLVKAGFLGAGALTMTWWTLLAFGLWRAMAWAGI